MYVLAGLDPSLPLADVPAFAQRVERLGYDGLHVAETVHDSLLVSLLVAEHTERITIRTALTLAFPRSPLLTAYSAWDVQAVSNGRFELGLATQIRQNITDRYGMEWSEPVQRMREYVECVRAAFTAFTTGEKPDYRGEHYRLTRLQPYFVPQPTGHPAPPIWLGGVNQGICELAGEVGDGFVSHPTNSLPVYLDAVALPAIDRGAEHGGRARPPVVVSAPVTTSPTTDGLAEAREGQRTSLAFLYSTPAYWRTLELLGLDELGPRLQRLTREGEWGQLGQVVTDDVLETLTIAATYADVPGALQSTYGDRVSGTVLHPPKDEADDDAWADVIRRLR